MYIFSLLHTHTSGFLISNICYKITWLPKGNGIFQTVLSPYKPSYHLCRQKKTILLLKRRLIETTEKVLQWKFYIVNDIKKSHWIETVRFSAYVVKYILRFITVTRIYEQRCTEGRQRARTGFFDALFPSLSYLSNLKCFISEMLTLTFGTRL